MTRRFRAATVTVSALLVFSAVGFAPSAAVAAGPDGALPGPGPYTSQNVIDTGRDTYLDYLGGSYRVSVWFPDTDPMPCSGPGERQGIEDFEFEGEYFDAEFVDEEGELIARAATAGRGWPTGFSVYDYAVQISDELSAPVQGFLRTDCVEPVYGDGPENPPTSMTVLREAWSVPFTFTPDSQPLYADTIQYTWLTTMNTFAHYAVGFTPGESVQVTLVDGRDSANPVNAGTTIATADGAGGIIALLLASFTTHESHEGWYLLAAGESSRLISQVPLESEDETLFEDFSVSAEVVDEPTEGADRGVAVHLSGYEPYAKVRVALHSDSAPIVLGTIDLGPSGTYSAILPLPNGTTGDFALWAGTYEGGFLLNNTPLSVTTSNGSGPALPVGDRFRGASRYGTAVEISKHAYPSGAQTVVVATGQDYPDSLSAAPLGAKLGAPLLLTAPAALSPETKAEIQRLNPTRILIVGGKGAVSDAVKAELEQLAPTVQRLSGKNRYLTSVAIAREGWSKSDNAFIATGAGFADALSAGAAAGSIDAPVILVPSGQGTAPTEVMKLLNDLEVEKIYVSGGRGAVSAAMESSLRAGGKQSERFAGSSRYATSALIGQAFHTPGGNVYVANGTGFADALAGAAVAGAQEAPLMLSTVTCVPAEIQRVQKQIAPSSILLLGGTGALSEAVRNNIVCR